MSDQEHERIHGLGIGRPTVSWTLLCGVLLLAVAWGAYAYSLQLRHGLITSGMRTIGQGGAAWGLYIAFDVYFVGVSFAGITVAALVRLFHLKSLEVLSRAAELLTIVALLVAGLVIVADLGRPLEGLLFLPLYARPSSPFFGTFTLVVAGYLFASLVYFYLAGRADAAACARAFPRFGWAYRIWASGHRGTTGEHARHFRATFWLSLLVLPLLVIAHSTLGFVFGIQGGRPGWFSALQAPSFVVLAGISGLGVLIVIAGAIRRFMGLQERIQPQAFRMLGNFLWVLIFVYLYFMIVEELTASYAAAEAETHVAHEVVFGPYAWAFWGTVGCLVLALLLLLAQFLSQRSWIGVTVLSGFVVNVAAILKRYVIVVPSQTHGMLLPYGEGSYTPSWVELSVVIGLAALAALLYVIFLKVFPIVPVVERELPHQEIHEALHSEPRRRRRIRETAFTLTLGSGLILSVAGLLLSLRVGTLWYLDPVVPYSPVIFILGVMASFYSAAVYETVPRAAK